MKSEYEEMKHHVGKHHPFAVPLVIDEIWPNLTYHERNARIHKFYSYLTRDARWGEAKKAGTAKYNFKKKAYNGHEYHYSKMLVLWELV